MDGALQVVLLGVAVMAGVLVQWKLTPKQLFARGRARKALPVQQSKPDNDGGGKNVTVYINRAVMNKPAATMTTPTTVPVKSETTPTAVAA